MLGPAAAQVARRRRRSTNRATFASGLLRCRACLHQTARSRTVQLAAVTEERSRVRGRRPSVSAKFWRRTWSSVCRRALVERGVLLEQVLELAPHEVDIQRRACILQGISPMRTARSASSPRSSSARCSTNAARERSTTRRRSMTMLSPSTRTAGRDGPATLSATIWAVSMRASSCRSVTASVSQPISQSKKDQRGKSSNDRLSRSRRIWNGSQHGPVCQRPADPRH